MASLSANCNVSLSKKLREILGKDDRVSVVLTAEVVNGKGRGHLSLDASGFNNVPEDISEIGETCIIITPSDVADETPTNASVAQGTIFSTVPKKGESSPVVDKMAAVHAPEKGEEAHAVVAKEKVKTPAAFSELDTPECKKWVSNMEELVYAVNAAKAKRSDIDPDVAQTDREKALLFEMKEREEAIDVPAWIINDQAGILTINDLDITLPLNSPYDLGNISARRIMMSRDLKGLLRSGFVRFISPSEAAVYAEQSVGNTVEAPGLDVFDSPEAAEANMVNSVGHNPVIDPENAMDVSEDDINTLTEEEAMISELRKDMPTVKTSSNTAPRHTKHGSPQTPSPDSGIKPIRKLS
jgi:hypothetical protein